MGEETRFTLEDLQIIKQLVTEANAGTADGKIRLGMLLKTTDKMIEEESSKE